MRTQLWLMITAIGVSALGFVGCASNLPADFRGPSLEGGSVPNRVVSLNLPAIETARLMEHVEVLTSPEFAGRLPLSEGGLLAGAYIAEYFASYGLATWEDEPQFAQRFGAGINLIGVLPGSDPALADEFVVISAHYDHLGVENGQMFQGAADNAAGTAVLLETARVLATAERRPSRSVVFAAFDAEEQGLYGSYIFTSRDDFDEDRFAGLVNLDMLGRATFDARDNTLIAVDSRRFPRLREAVLAAGERAGMDVLPVGRELVGPRSDHVSFEPMGRPWVFLTCGPFADYHTPRDTADKLDYSAIERSAQVALDAAVWLADAETIESATNLITGDRVELDAVIEITSMLSNTLPPQFAPAVRSITQQAEGWRDAVDYSLEDNTLMHHTLNLAMMPITYGRMLNFKEMNWVMQARRFYIEETDRFVKQRRVSIVEEYGDPENVPVKLEISPATQSPADAENTLHFDQVVPATHHSH